MTPDLAYCRVCAILEAAGFPISWGGSAREAVEYLDEHLPRSRPGAV